MAWARDKNGKEVWLDESGDGGRGARGRMETNSPQDVSMTLPAPTSYDQGIEAGKIAQRTRQYDLRSFASREAADLAGAGSDAHILPPLDSVPARPAWVLESPAAPAGGGSLHGGPTDVAGRGMLPAPGPRMPVSLPPVTVEATRLPPVVEGVTMRRGAPGSGVIGERMDLTPVGYRRDTPMSMRDAAAAGLFESRVPKGVSMDPSDAYRAGLIDVYAGRGAPQGPQDMTAANRINATPGMRAFDMEMRSEAAAAMRQGFLAESRARHAAAAMRATGRVGASRDIVAKILGEEQADAASDRRMREARVTPVASGDTVYDPVTGKAHTPAKGPLKAQPLDALDDNDILAGLSKYGQPKPMTAKELADADTAAWAAFQSEKDPEKKRAYLQTQWTDDNRRVYEQYRKAAAARGLIADGGGGVGGGGSVYKPGMLGKR